MQNENMKNENKNFLTLEDLQDLAELRIIYMEENDLCVSDLVD